jgi:hypothetical protein
VFNVSIVVITKQKEGSKFAAVLLRESRYFKMKKRVFPPSYDYAF